MGLTLQPGKQYRDQKINYSIVLCVSLGGKLSGRYRGQQLYLCAPLTVIPVCHRGQEFEISCAWEGSWTDREPMVLWLIPPQQFFIGCMTTTQSSAKEGLVVVLSFSEGSDTSLAFPSKKPFFFFCLGEKKRICFQQKGEGTNPFLEKSKRVFPVSFSLQLTARVTLCLIPPIL